MIPLPPRRQRGFRFRQGEVFRKEEGRSAANVRERRCRAGFVEYASLAGRDRVSRTRIIAFIEPYKGYYQTIDYAYWEHSSALPTLVPITEMQVKSQIARPGFSEVVPAGATYRVHGAAWTGSGEIVKVELSVDNGTTWSETRLIGESTAHAWRLWEYDWSVPTTLGRVVLMARATDSEGRIQPFGHLEDHGSYIIHHCLPIEVTIR